MSNEQKTRIKGTAIQTPLADGSNTRTVVSQLKETVEIGQRLRGDPLDSFVRVRELVQAGIVRLVNGTLQPIAGGSSTYVTNTRNILTTASLTGGGSLASDLSLSLVNDILSPGNSFYYGTNNVGSKGWFALPAGGGATGAQGPPGTPYEFEGPEGPEGPMGPPGMAGTAGAPGAQGPAGIPYEFEGPEGPEGPMGPPGVAGAQGSPGSTGAQGPQGPPFEMEGPEGPEGPMGPPGAAGAQGSPGSTGAQGPAAIPYEFEGPEGPEGPMGPPGAAGAQGSPGSTGAQGPAAIPYEFEGPEGPEGPMGPPGVAGAQGSPGSTGAQGPAAIPYELEGPPGEDAWFGPPGNPGAQGAPGTTGAQGPAAIPYELEGPPGEDAWFGPQGNQGPQGVTGAQGPMGPPFEWDGPPGEDAWFGPQGNQGPQGVTGAQGPLGPATHMLVDEDACDVEWSARYAGELNLGAPYAWTGAHLFRGSVNYFGAVAQAAVDMSADSGSFVATPTGLTSPSPATVTVLWRRQGNHVTMTVPGCTGTSSSTAFTFTYSALPASIVPASTKWIAVPLIEDAGAFLSKNAAVLVASTVMTFAMNGSSTGFTASGVKGVSSQICFGYDLS